jgi:hypothetical protein
MILRLFCKVFGSTAAEKQTIRRGLTLKPSNWFKSVVLPQTLGLDAGSQLSPEAGRLIRIPVFCAPSLTESASLGKGPAVSEAGWNSAVVCPANRLRLRLSRTEIPAILEYMLTY